MVRDDEIERIAVDFAIQHEEARGWRVESVEKENRGFDLISRRPHPEDPKTAFADGKQPRPRSGAYSVAKQSRWFGTLLNHTFSQTPPAILA